MTEFDKVIHPGGVGKITASIHTTNFKGPVSKSVTVTTNDPEHATFTLQIKANIVVPLDIQPSENVAFNGKSDALEPQVLTITSTSKEAFDILEAKPADANFEVKVEAAPESGTAPKAKSGTVASGVNRYKVTVTPAKGLPVGRVNSSVNLKTSLAKAPEQSIRIFGTVTGDVDVQPTYVTLATGPLAPPEGKVSHVRIRKETGAALKISGVTSDNPAIATKLETVTEGREFDLEVSYTGEPMTAPLTSKIKIATNDAKQPSIEVPVWGRSDSTPRPQAGLAGQPVQLQGKPMPIPAGQPVPRPVQARPTTPAPPKP